MTSASPRYRIVRGYSDWQVETLPAFGEFWQYIACFETFEQAAEYLRQSYGLKVSIVVLEE